MRKLNFIRLHASAVSCDGGERDSGTSEAWESFVRHVDEAWALPELQETDAGWRSAFVDRASQLLSKLPRREDGEHAEWLNETPEGGGARFNAMEACLRRHAGEIHSTRVWYQVPWESDDLIPPTQSGIVPATRTAATRIGLRRSLATT